MLGVFLIMRRGSPCGCPGNRKGYPYKTLPDSLSIVANREVNA